VTWSWRPPAAASRVAAPRLAQRRAPPGGGFAAAVRGRVREALSAIGARVVDSEIPVPTADEIVHDREKLESSGTNSLVVGLLAELIDLARERDAIAA
jgi:hypothetical protein